MELESKLGAMGVTIFTRMTNLANQAGAINLSQGFPDLEVHPDLIERVYHYMKAGCNQYAPMPGVLALRQAIAAKTESLYGRRYDPESEITVTSGATEALFAAISATVRPGDEVILFEPAFDVYAPAVLLNGGRPVYLTMKVPGYTIDWDEVRRAVNPKTRLLVINSPHNPTGTLLTPDDLDTLATILKTTNALLVSDEVYEHIVFDGHRHASAATVAALAERSFVISSFGKTYHTTGWKIGYCLAPESLSREFRKAHQYITFASNTPIQHAYADFMRHRELYEELGTFYQAKRDLFLKLISPSRFAPLPCLGTYFLMLDYSGISSEADTAFAEQLTTEHGVAAIPPSVFYQGGDDHRVLRFCFAKKDETLVQAAERLCRI